MNWSGPGVKFVDEDDMNADEFAGAAGVGTKVEDDEDDGAN